MTARFEEKENDPRPWMASHLMDLTFLVIGALLISIVIFALRNPKSENLIPDTFNTLMPVLTAWLGSVLTFYYSKDNLNAANENALKLITQVSPQERLKSIPASEKMLPLSKIKSLPGNPSIQDLDEFFRKNKYFHRVPILDDHKGALKCVIHKSLMNEFLVKNHLQFSQTVQNLLDDQEFGQMAKGTFDFVAKESTMADVKAKMDTSPSSYPVQDVFVTETGSDEEPILGWITNIMVAKAAQFTPNR